MALYYGVLTYKLNIQIPLDVLSAVKTKPFWLKIELTSKFFAFISSVFSLAILCS